MLCIINSVTVMLLFGEMPAIEPSGSISSLTGNINFRKPYNPETAEMRKLIKNLINMTSAILWVQFF